MTERIFRVERNGIQLFETNLNPGDGVYLSQAADLYIASLGAEAPPDVEEVQGEMTVEAEDSETPVAQAEGGEVPEPEEVTEEELEADEEEALEEDYYEDWTVDQLKDALRSRGLMVSGTKDELIQRLGDNDEEDDE